VCDNAGRAPNQCGPGIPLGTPLAFNQIYANQPPVNKKQTEAFASECKKVGITVTTESGTFNDIVSNYSDISVPATINKWAMLNFGGFTNSLYPTTVALFNTGGTYNLGNYSDPMADTLIHNSIFGGDPSAVKAEASYLAENLPGLFLPSADNIAAWKKTLSGPPEAFSNLTQSGFTPEYWYFTTAQS